MKAREQNGLYKRTLKPQRLASTKYELGFEKSKEKDFFWVSRNQKKLFWVSRGSCGRENSEWKSKILDGSDREKLDSPREALSKVPTGGGREEKSGQERSSVW
ncbi:hypothetical protein ACOSP7_007133 [Xanthoceras sorbifolium]